MRDISVGTTNFANFSTYKGGQSCESSVQYIILLSIIILCYVYCTCAYIFVILYGNHLIRLYIENKNIYYLRY